MRSIPIIDYSEAKRIIDLIVERASEMQKSVVVAVADPHGELIACARMDGAPISSIRIAANKAWTAARERKATKEIGEKVRHPEKGHDIAYYGESPIRRMGRRYPYLEEWRGSRCSCSQRPLVA
jgi:glc operon protein GlcG